MLGSLGLQDKRKTNAFVLVAIMSTSSTAFAGCCAATSAQLSILAGSAVVRMPLVTARVRGMCRCWPWSASATSCRGFFGGVSICVPLPPGSRPSHHGGGCAGEVFAVCRRMSASSTGSFIIPFAVMVSGLSPPRATGQCASCKLLSDAPGSLVLARSTLGCAAIASEAATSCDQGNSAIACPPIAYPQQLTLEPHPQHNL